MGKKLKQMVALGMAAVMMLSLAACGGSSSNEPADASISESGAATAAAADDGEAVSGGSLTAYYTEFYSEYDPAASAKRAFISMYCDMLWNLDWDSDTAYVGSYLDEDMITGQVAESWEVADDYSSMTVTLRDDVYFQDKTEVGMDEEYDIYDGRQLTAEDVKWSYDRLLGLDGAEKVDLEETSWDEFLYMLDSVEVVDDLTVTFHFNTTSEVAVSSFMCARVLLGGSEWDELTDEQKSDWHYAAGTGPFIITDYVGENTMTLTKNPGYWDTDSEGNALPYLDEVKLVNMTESTTVLSSFISGEIDMVAVANAVFDSDEITQMESALGEDGFYKYSFYSSPMSIGLKQGNNPVEALTDVRVRMALQYAMDLEAMSEFMGYTYDEDSDVADRISGVFSGNTAWGDTSEWSDELLESYTTYDPDKAKELLEEAGYGDGFTFDCTIFSQLPTDLFTLAAEYLDAVGVTMNINLENSPADMTSVGEDADDPACVFFNLGMDSLSSLSMRVCGDMSYVKQDNAEIEALCEEVQNATTLEDQIEKAKELDQTYMEEHYLLYISYSEKYDNFYQNYVHGVHGSTPYSNWNSGYVFARIWMDAE